MFRIGTGALMIDLTSLRGYFSGNKLAYPTFIALAPKMDWKITMPMTMILREHTLCRNLVSFHPVTFEFTKLEYVQQVSNNTWVCSLIDTSINSGLCFTTVCLGQHSWAGWAICLAVHFPVISMKFILQREIIIIILILIYNNTAFL